MPVSKIQNAQFMQLDNSTVHDAVHDVWDMQVSFDDEVKLSFSGKKQRTVSDVLVGVKQYMETEIQKLRKQTK